jgi:hypothetical protein
MLEDTDHTYNFRINWLKTRAEADLFKARGMGYLPLTHKDSGNLLVDIMMLHTNV